jgi:hypothetical protein
MDNNEAFYKWYLNEFQCAPYRLNAGQKEIHERRLLERGYKAAQAESAKEIAELEKIVLEAQSYFMRSQREIKELKADNERLREFLRWECDALLNGQNPEWSKKYRSLLSATSSQSLQAHDNEVKGKE